MKLAQIQDLINSMLTKTLGYEPIIQPIGIEVNKDDFISLKVNICDAIVYFRSSTKEQEYCADENNYLNYSNLEFYGWSSSNSTTIDGMKFSELTYIVSFFHNKKREACKHICDIIVESLKCSTGENRNVEFKQEDRKVTFYIGDSWHITVAHSFDVNKSMYFIFVVTSYILESYKEWLNNQSS